MSYKYNSFRYISLLNLCIENNNKKIIFNKIISKMKFAFQSSQISETSLIDILHLHLGQMRCLELIKFVIHSLQNV